MRFLALLALLPCAAFGTELRVDGEGYLRVLDAGRVVYARSGELGLSEGKLALNGRKFVPNIGASSLAGIRIDLDGKVWSGSANIGQLYVSLFTADAGVQASGEFFTATARGSLRLPGDGEAGVVRFGNAPVTAMSGRSQPILKASSKAAPSQGLVISLKPKAEVSGAKVSLGDVADIDGPAERTEFLKNISLGDLPAVGRTRSIERPTVLDALKKAGLHAEDLVVKGLGPIVVSRSGQEIAFNAFVDAAKAAAKEKMGDEYGFDCNESGTSFNAPLGSVELRPESAVAKGKSCAVTLGIYIDGKRVNSRTVNLNVQAPTPGCSANESVSVLFRKNDLVVEAKGRTKKAAALGGKVEVMVTLGEKGTETVHVGVVVAPGVVEVRL